MTVLAIINDRNAELNLLGNNLVCFFLKNQSKLSVRELTLCPLPVRVDKLGCAGE